MFYWLPVLIYAGLIFYISSLPFLEVSHGIIYLDPQSLLLHLFEYIPLGFFLARAVSKTKNLFTLHPIFFPVLIGSTYGLSDEFHQYFVPGRTPSPMDFFDDTIGVILGVFLWGFILSNFFKFKIPRNDI
jgi:VanZ family protein